MRTASATFVLLLLAMQANAPGARAAGRVYQVDYPASTTPGELAMAVTYRLWIPDDCPTLRGVIVHQHGCGEGACRGGETAADDLHWQALAQKWNCALLGPRYHQAEMQNCRLWCDPRNGSRLTFLRCLDDFAQQSGHAELSRVPWCLWGHSGGGYWASLMQASDPTRIVAIWLRSGTAYHTWESGEITKPDLPAEVYTIPVMANPGAKERDDMRFAKAWSGPFEMFEAYRAHGAPIGFAPDPRTSHECGDSRYLAIPFFDACLALRLPEKDAADQALRKIPADAGWRAIPLTDQVFAASEAPREATAWLPNEAVGRAWAEYVRTGAVSDTTPPPAPTKLKVTQTNGKPTLTWDAQADMESGVAGFSIARDGVEIARLPEKPIGRFGRPLWQTMSYHDTPEQPLPQMTFTDATLSAPEGSAPTELSYEVRAINSAGLKSDATSVSWKRP